MKTTEVRKNILTTFIMIELVKGHLETREAVDNMLALIQKKLNMSVKESVDFLRNAIGINA